jgi:uracil-DNA glycosylase
MPFNIAQMFKGVDKKWVKVFTSKKMMPLLSKALKDLEIAEPDVKNITPQPNDIFNFARLTPYGKIKVVIIGQDPYPKNGDAHGLAFSSLAKKVPASLKNIYKCLQSQNLMEEGKSNTSDLTGWAKQGVLLLNAALTTKVGSANAHAAIWRPFTDALIAHISEEDGCGPGCSMIFMLWGNFAHKKEKVIDDDCAIYKWLHPSPLAQASAADKDKFINCPHFVDVNTLLTQTMGLTPIDWDPLPTHVVYTDGACSNNGKGIFSSTGHATYFAKGPFANTVIYGKVPPAIIGGSMVYGTNQRGEGLGIIYAIEEVVSMGIPANTTVVTDSDFWKKMMEDYMPAWDRKGIDFKSKKNPDLTTRLYAAVNNVERLGTLSIIHVASHNKDPNAPPEHVAGNAVADDYANKGKALEAHEIIREQI